MAGGGTPEAMFETAKSAVEEGFTALKFDPVIGGYQDMALDRLVKTARDLVAAAREGGGPDLDLIVEVHRKLTPMNSIVLRRSPGAIQPLFSRRPHPDRLVSYRKPRLPNASPYPSPSANG